MIVTGLIIFIAVVLACMADDDIEDEQEPRHLSYPRRRALRKQARKASAQRFGDRTK
jgi:hypothetical protein